MEEEDEDGEDVSRHASAVGTSDARTSSSGQFSSRIDGFLRYECLSTISHD